MTRLNHLANAPSQAHLQGTQSQHTGANLAKEPAFHASCDTLCFGGHILSTQSTKAKDEHTTWVADMLADE